MRRLDPHAMQLLTEREESRRVLRAVRREATAVAQARFVVMVRPPDSLRVDEQGMSAINQQLAALNAEMSRLRERIKGINQQLVRLGVREELEVDPDVGF